MINPLFFSTFPASSIRLIALIGSVLQSPSSSFRSLNRVVMSKSGGFSVSRAHSDSRFYNPPPVRRHQQLLLLQQQQKQKMMRSEAALVDSPKSERAWVDTDDTDESALSLSRSDPVCASLTLRSADLTHLDRIIESVTPSVRAHHLHEVRASGGSRRESDLQQYFSLSDLWEAFREWSVYGVGVPLVLNGSETVKQYYVPSLSGIQLYIDTQRMRKRGEDSDMDSLRETSSSGSSDFEAEWKGKGNADGMKSQQSIVNSNSQKMNRLALTTDDKPLSISSGDEAEAGNSSGQLVFEYLEREQPHHRKPLYDKVSYLAAEFPELKRFRSCDLSTASWIAVAWYPIYRIPVGPTLQNLDASFLTFHRLSTHSRGKIEPQLHVSSVKKVHGLDLSSRFSLPVFGLASYKLRGSILTPNSTREQQQANSLLQAADEWLRQLQVNLPDYQFFISHNSHWR